jgi:DNA-binding beta-propeller fold protein YncE
MHSTPIARRDFLLAAGALALPVARARAASTRTLLYVAEPGIRNYTQFGGVGVLVYDASDNYRFVKRISTWDVLEGQVPDNVKGIAASAHTGHLYVTNIRRICCIDLGTDKIVWDTAPEGGCDRLAISPDGATLYVPSFEGPHWNVLDAASGNPIARIVTNSSAHNTIYSTKGRFAYLAGLKSPLLSVADTRTHQVVKHIGPFSNVIRPFTVNANETLCYVNVNELLGFEIGDLRTRKKLHRIEIEGVERGPVERHGCPSHGIGLTPDQRELWVCDGHNKLLHVFDNTVMPPRPKARVPVREQPGWITFSLDGRRAYPSTGEVFDVRTKHRIAALDDELARHVGSEKLIEIAFSGPRPIRAGNQFAVGG